MLLLAGLALSCVPLIQYHTEAPDPAAGGACQAESGTCSAAFIEEQPEYLLGFVEFDDLGWSWQRQQQHALIARLEQEIKERDVLMVVFVHGWKHNAESCDSNVTCFREVLRQLHATETALAGKGTPRRIVGIYVGWRGDSARGKLLRQTTFFGRKSTAHRVGSGAVTELLVRLKEIRNRRHRQLEAATPPHSSSTRLVLVGHSFGAALLYSATSPLIMERMAVAAASDTDRLVRGFGDLVVLVNPAFEAARYQPLNATAEEGGFPPEQKPVLAIITSQGDKATGKAFPLGRSFSAKFDDYRSGPLRGEQRRANIRAVGHFAPYRTHWLNANPATPELSKPNRDLEASCECPSRIMAGPTVSDAEVTQTVADLRAHQWADDAELEFPTSTLVLDPGKLPANSPLMVISVDADIIPNHSDIYQLAFVDFLRYLIMSAGDPLEYPEG